MPLFFFGVYWTFHVVIVVVSVADVFVVGVVKFHHYKCVNHHGVSCVQEREGDRQRQTDRQVSYLE